MDSTVAFTIIGCVLAFVAIGKDYLFMAQTSYFTGKDFKGRDVLLRSFGLGFGFQ